jgi:hypothetical protein
MLPRDWEYGKVWELNLHTPKWIPTLGIGISMDSRFFKEWLQGSKPMGLRSLLFNWKNIVIYMFKMGLHDPFGHLKQKLWSKEGPRLSTIKSRELTRFPCVKVACNISLERPPQRLQLCFKPHLNRRFAHKTKGPKILGVPEQNDIWVLAPWPCIKYIIGGKVVDSPKFKPWWVLWV